MNKTLIIKILIFLLIFNNLKSQKNNTIEYQNDELIQNLGIGLIQVLNIHQIKLFSDNSFSKKINLNIGNKLIPILNKPDYGILIFVCVEKKPNYYKIAITKNDFAYIKPSQYILFYNWDTFLKDQVSSIEIKNIKNNPPRNLINGNPLNIKNWKKDDEIEVIKIQANWIQIKNITQNKFYWLQWRNEKELQVYLNLLI